MSEADDERSREREVILQRRARLAAYAVAAGVAAVACSGKTSTVCLSIAEPTGGGTPVTTAGRGYCLSISSGGYGGVTVGGGSGGYCLSPPVEVAGAGGVTYCLQPPLTGGANAAGDSGAGGEGGAATGDDGSGGNAGTGGASPAAGTTFCLVPPA